MAKWKSIETAPKMANVIVSVPISFPGVQAKYTVGEARQHEYGDWYWANEGPGDYHADCIFPTHWMSLPEPPK